MRIRVFIICIIFFGTVFITVDVFAGSYEDMVPEYKVSKGETKTYIVSEYYDIEDRDNNGDPYSTTFQGMTVTGKLVDLTLKKGTIIELKVINFSNLPIASPEILVQITYDSQTPNFFIFCHSPTIPIKEIFRIRI